MEPDYYSTNKKYILADLILWKRLNGNKISNCRFQRHAVIEGRSVNYLCEEKKLVIQISTELKGMIHEKEIALCDFLESKGYTVRFFNYESIIADVEGVTAEIKNVTE